MKSINAVFHAILYNNSEYCGLCFQIITEIDAVYKLHDDVVLESESVEDLYEILFDILGEEVMNSLSSSTICRKCTLAAIQSYKFIKMCNTNVNQLICNITCFKDLIENVPPDNECNKSLFISLDTAECYGNYFYDKKHFKKADLLHKTFKCMQEYHNTISIDIELEPENIDSKFVCNKKKQKSIPNKLRYKKEAHLNIPYEFDSENNYKCKACLKTYGTHLKLKQHYFRVHAPKSFKCTKCPRSFGSSLLLKSHIKNSHCKVVCSQCGKVYNSIYSLRDHEKKHKLRLVCQTCGKVYKGKQSFHNHIVQKLCQKQRKSNSEAKFDCNYCPKKYAQKTALRVHIRLEHENGKALKCQWCEKKLSSESRLKDHILKHTKQKNFDCDICGGKFVTKMSLLYHTRTHTGEKPYACELCNMRFLSASRRSEHVKQQHAQCDVECDICHNKFKGQYHYLRHRKRHFDVSSTLFHDTSKE